MTEPRLPTLLEEIAGVAGWDAAWQLTRAKGGQKIFLPKSAGRHHWLTGIVGHEAANAICRHFRSNHQSELVIPIARASLHTDLWRRVIAEGGSINEQAARTESHVRTVSRWRRRYAELRPAKKANGQGDLF